MNRTKLFTRLAQFDLGVHILDFAGKGTLGLLDPVSKLESIGLAATSPEGITAFRAIYGGLMITLGCLFTLALLKPGMMRFGLMAIVAVMLSIIFTRSLGMVLDDTSNARFIITNLVELFSAGFALFLLYKAPAESLR